MIICLFSRVLPSDDLYTAPDLDCLNNQTQFSNHSETCFTGPRDQRALLRRRDPEIPSL